MGKEINFSVCLITKNEEKTLPRLLLSLIPFKAQGGKVYILDTGSTDLTVSIARDWGCVVEEVGEKYLHTVDAELADAINNKFVVEGEKPVLQAGDKYFDFASARNHAASLSHTKWVSFADADEDFTALNIAKIGEVLDSDPTLANLEYQFVFSHDYFGKPAIQFIQSKMYDREKLRWTGIVHECLEPVTGTDPSSFSRKYLTPDIFLLEHWQQPGDRHSYLRGLAVDCYQNPHKDRNSHYFARELFWAGRPHSAIKEFKRHVEMNGWLAERSQSMIFIGDAYGTLNLPEQQVQWYNEAFKADSSRREALIKLALFYKHNKNYQAAVSYTKAAMEIPWTPFYANDRAHYEHLPHEILYQSYGWLGKLDEAREHLLKALKLQPLNPQYLHDTRYYFEYFDRAIEGYMTFDELTWLYRMSKQVRTVAEIGSFKGRSTHALLSGGAHVTAIDHFQGSEDEKDGTHGKLGVFEEFTRNTNGFSNLTVKKMSGSDAAKEDGSYDMVFIDAGHTYDEVVADIRAWKGKAKMVLAGHDYCEAWPEVMKAVNDELQDYELHVEGSIWYVYMVPSVSFILPTIAGTRPAGLQACLDSIKSLKYPQGLLEVVIMDGEGTVPQKVQRGFKRTKGDYIVYAADDMTFEPECIYNAVLASKQFERGLVSFNEGPLLPDEGNINTHFLMSRELVYKLGEIFSTKFHHVGCDNLLWAKAKKLGQNHHCLYAKIQHNHFSKGVSLKDSVYDKGWSRAEEDRRTLSEELLRLSQ